MADEINPLIQQEFRPIRGRTLLLFLAALIVLVAASSAGFWFFRVVWPPLVLMAVFYGLILLAAVLALLPLGRSALPALAIRGASWKPVVLGPVATLAVSVAVSQVVPELEGMKQVAELVRTPNALLASLLVLAVLAPLVEELMFRGLLYGWIDGRWGSRAALGVSAIAFALAHYQWGAEGWERLAYALAVLPLGLLFSWLRRRTDSLLPSVVSHMVNNGFAVISAAWLGS